MLYEKVKGAEGWIVFVIKDDLVIQIHSNGLVTKGRDDREKGQELMSLLVEEAKDNALHSQYRDGIRF